MNCPKHNCKMIQLFSSWACDVCDNKIEENKNDQYRIFKWKLTLDNLPLKDPNDFIHNNLTRPFGDVLIGCTIYNTDDKEFQIYDGNEWKSIRYL